MREITYHKEGDYYIPDLYLVEDEYEKNYHIGKYGHLRLEYLKNHKKAEYTIMLMDGTLRKHIRKLNLMLLPKWELVLANLMLSKYCQLADEIFNEGKAGFGQ